MKENVISGKGLLTEAEQPGSRDDLTVDTDKNLNNIYFWLRFSLANTVNDY